MTAPIPADHARLDFISTLSSRQATGDLKALKELIEQAANTHTPS